MNLDPDMKDNLTLMDRDGESSYLKPLLVLLGVALVVALVFYAYEYHRRHPKAADGSPAGKTSLDAREQQRALAEIKTFIASNAVALARQQCYELLQNTTNAATVKETEQVLGQINISLLMSPALMPEKVEYVVRPGDSLERLAKQHGTTVEMIEKCNSLRSRTIHPGDRLRIFNAKLEIFVSKSRNDLLLKAGDRFFKRYGVGTGKFGTTPAGTFVIADKIAEPPWWRPDGKMVPFGDKENVLGTRWMSIAATGTTPKVRGYGIHGTWEPETIGKQASAGCIRLVNTDVEELFLIVPVGTPVTIVE